MTAVAALFPGQGMQHEGIGGWLFRRCPDGARLLAELSDLAGRDLMRLCSRGSAEQLRQTQYTQPIMFAVGLAAYRYLSDLGVRPAIIAGHSLGEITALCAAGAMQPGAAGPLVVRRGQLMASVPGLGAMGRVAGLSRDAVQSCCDRVTASAGRVVIAVQNSPDEHIVSGDAAAVDGCLMAAEASGAVKAARIATSHAFHSPLMRPIMPDWRDVVAGLPLRRPQLPVVLNATGHATTDTGTIRHAMSEQISRPVEWWRGLCTMAALGVTTVVVCDTSRYLGMLARRAGLTVLSLAEPRQLERALKEGACGDALAADLQPSLV